MYNIKYHIHDPYNRILDEGVMKADTEADAWDIINHLQADYGFNVKIYVEEVDK